MTVCEFPDEALRKEAAWTALGYRLLVWGKAPCYEAVAL